MRANVELDVPFAPMQSCFFFRAVEAPLSDYAKLFFSRVFIGAFFASVSTEFFVVNEVLLIGFVVVTSLGLFAGCLSMGAIFSTYLECVVETLLSSTKIFVEAWFAIVGVFTAAPKLLKIRALVEVRLSVALVEVVAAETAVSVEAGSLSLHDLLAEIIVEARVSFAVIFVISVPLTERFARVCILFIFPIVFKRA